MRLKESRIAFISKVIVNTLVEEELIECDDLDEAIYSVKNVIKEDLLVEDKLDDEVKELIRSYQSELDSRRIEYVNMFRLIKDKLVKERNLIL